MKEIVENWILRPLPLRNWVSTWLAESGKGVKQYDAVLRKLLNIRGFNNATSSIVAILAGLLFGFIVLLISNPSQAADGFVIILKGGFSTGAKGMGQVMYFATPLILTGLSVGFAFKTGLFNIGASGQFIMGAFAAVYIGVKWTFIPAPFHWMVALLAATLVGALWR